MTVALRGAKRARRGRGWALVVLAAAGLVVLPVAVVVGSLLIPTPQVWAHLWATRLPGMLVTTLALMLTVALGTLTLGGGLAWLVTAYRFPGRRAFAWLLVLPLAMPAYVLGFVFLSLLSYAGPVQGAWRALFGREAWFPSVRSLAGAAVVLSLTLYPYVYLLARVALREQAATTYEAARTLGLSRLAAARRVVLPLARPSLAAGLVLVMMETLTDFASVQYFNVETVSVGVYRVWKGMFDRAAATELAALVLVFALAVVLLERGLRGRARYFQQGASSRGLETTGLRSWRAWSATAICGLVVGVAFFVPVLQLFFWVDTDTVGGLWGAFDRRYLHLLTDSLRLAAAAAVACVTLAALVTNGTRLHGGRLIRSAAHLTMVGYVVPGPVVAIGVLLVVAGTDRAVRELGLLSGGLLVTGSLVGLLYAYVVRFMALAYSGVEASLQKVSPSMTLAARALGASSTRILRRVHLPMIRSGVGVAFVLVLLDAMKELPIVLLLRPFGFETLSVWVWQLASESRWEGAGLPALTIVAAALVPVGILVRATESSPSRQDKAEPGRPALTPSPARVEVIS
ncbi:MAG: iron ABC transporter permease [Actinomycetota bacterium]|nr:iron ABC transporter permease [Actinomycetota bacterium]